MNISPPRLFEYLTEDCRPIAVKSRKQTPSNAKFIRDTIKNLLNDGVIKPSTSPWRAQVLVTKDDGTHKKWMVIDYKQTIIVLPNLMLIHYQTQNRWYGIYLSFHGSVHLI